MVNKKMSVAKVRAGNVTVSDGKCKPQPMRLYLTTELLKLQKEEIDSYLKSPPVDSRERTVRVKRRKDTGLGISIKGGAEHKLPILISRIFPRQAADETGQLFVGDAIIKVNNEYLTICPHDEALEVLRKAGDIVTLCVKHYKAATPFLQRTSSKESYLNHLDELRIEEYLENAEPKTNVKYVDIISVPLMMAYVTRYIFGTDKLRPNAFEVRGLNGTSTGVIHCADSANLYRWLKYITDNIVGLTNLQMKLYNRNFPCTERIEYMGWVNEGITTNSLPWQTYKPRFLTLKGMDILIFDSPPLNVVDWLKCGLVFKVYQTMFRILKDSEHKDERQHCFVIQTCGQDLKYLSVETRQELLRIEAAWNAAVCLTISKIGHKTFNVKWSGRQCGLTLDWNYGFILRDLEKDSLLWSYRFSQLKGSSDDGNSRLKLHFQETDSRIIETKVVEEPERTDTKKIEIESPEKKVEGKKVTPKKQSEGDEQPEFEDEAGIFGSLKERHRVPRKIMDMSEKEKEIMRQAEKEKQKPDDVTRGSDKDLAMMYEAYYYTRGNGMCLSPKHTLLHARFSDGKSSVC